jgi:hypothetical protein
VTKGALLRDPFFVRIPRAKLKSFHDFCLFTFIHLHDQKLVGFVSKSKKSIAYALSFAFLVTPSFAKASEGR